jgi:hypothetical protein
MVFKLTPSSEVSKFFQGLLSNPLGLRVSSLLNNCKVFVSASGVLAFTNSYACGFSTLFASDKTNSISFVVAPLPRLPIFNAQFSLCLGLY